MSVMLRQHQARRLSDAAIERVAARLTPHPTRRTAIVVKREELADPQALEARLLEEVGYVWTVRELIERMHRHPDARGFLVEPVCCRGWTYTPVREDDGRERDNGGRM